MTGAQRPTGGDNPIIRCLGTREVAARFVYAIHRSLLERWLDGVAGQDVVAHFSRERILYVARTLAEHAEWGVICFHGHRPADSVKDLIRAISRRCKECGIRSSQARRRGPQPSWAWYESTGLVSALLGDAMPEQSDQSYFVAQAIRRNYAIPFGSELTRTFYTLAEVVNRGGSESGRSRDYRSLFDTLVTNLGADRAAGIVDTGERRLTPELWVQAFLEAGHLAAAIVPHEFTSTKVRVRPRELDAEFLIAHLFDLPTQVRGLSDLFGGVGPRFIERIAEGGSESTERQRDASPNTIPGRFLLVTGVCGSGKSLLSLSLAHDVARLGGVAWYFPLEQSAEECQIVLSSLVGRNWGDCIRVAANVEAATAYLADESQPDMGLLALLKFPYSTLQQALTTLQDHAVVVDELGAMRISGRHLLCIDPINAVLDAEDDFVGGLARSGVAQLIGGLTRKGYNVLVVLEDRLDGTLPATFLENLADTVVHLSVDDQDDRLSHGYARRRIEILKSRYQREQRGRHPFSIRPATGINVFPGTAAFRIRNRARSIKFGGRTGSSGLPSLDEVLGVPAPVRAGMMMAVQGPIGTYKTHLALAFLRAPSVESAYASKGRADAASSDMTRRTRNLFVTSRMHESQVEQIQAVGLLDSSSAVVPFDVLELPSGFSTTGQMLAAIDQRLRDLRAQGLRVERIALDDFGEWSSLNPFVRDDEAFATTLFDYLRRRELAIFITLTSESKEARSSLHKTVIDLADTLIELYRIEHVGRQKVLLRILQSHDMRHRAENFELGIGGNQRLHVDPNPSLLRISELGMVTVAPLRLLLRSETKLQADYNRRLLEVLKARTSTSVIVDRLDPLALRLLGPMQQVNTLDEVQIWQLDEFQVAEIDANASEPSFAQVQDPLSESRLAESDHRRFHGVKNGLRWAWPYYDNLSFLVYRIGETRDSRLVDLFERHSTNSEQLDGLEVWKRLAALCLEDARIRGPDAVFFDFPKASDENYNSLFLEFLAAAAPPDPSDRGTGRINLVAWLDRAGESAIEAISCFHAVCHRAHLVSARGKWIAGRRLDSIGSSENDHWEGIRVSKSAFVWRHWYTTWTQMMVELRKEGCDFTGQLRMCPLPGGVTTAGEWYLAVPRDSANPTVAQILIRSLCSKETELDRFHAGAGLPTRATLYPPLCDESSEALGLPGRDASLFRELAPHAFQRSSIARYHDISPLLGHHLRRFLDIETLASDKDGTLGLNVNAVSPSRLFLKHLRSSLQKLLEESGG